MKISRWLGPGAGLLLILVCFLPWAYYPDLDKYFTGFFSEKNIYGRPGKFLIFFALVAMALFLIPRIWAKRANLLVTALILAYAIKTYFLFTSCYHGICPEKKAAIFLLLLAPCLMVVAALFPDYTLKEEEPKP